MRVVRGFLDSMVPPEARGDHRRRLRYRGIAKSLVAISAVVAVLFLLYYLVRPELTRQEALLFVVAIVSPTLGALFVRFTGRIDLGLFLTNIAGIGIVAYWCWVTGGITSVAVHWFLPNLFLLSTFGNRRMLITTAGALVVVLTVLFLGTHQGWIPANQIPEPLIPTFEFMSMLSSVAVVVLAAIAVTEERDKSKEHLLAAKEAAEAANRAKSAFLTSMSHELRTPLNAVMLSGDLLKDDQDPPLSPKQLHVVDQMLQGAEVLLALVNQVLQLSSIEAGKTAITIEETSLSEVLTSSFSVIVPLAERKEVKVHCDLESLSELRVLADPMQLKSALINLLSNAVKYNSSQGRVFVTAGETQDGKVRIQIRDTGAGIPDRMRQAAFQPFNRLGAEGTSIEGTGLGLSITERLIRMMSGSLGFESVQGEGSTFWVELPAASKPAPRDSSLGSPAASAPEKPSPATPLKVLIAEDHPVNQQLLRRTLEKWGHRVTVVGNGQEALEALTGPGLGRPGFDVILMDLLMPGMDGLEATRRIRQMESDGGHHRIPIVAVTACAMDTDREACFEAGMDHYIAKPIKPQELAGILQRIPPGRPPR